MAHTLNLVCGSTTINLHGSGLTFRYTPRSGDGTATITETVDLQVGAASVTDAQTVLRDIRRLLKLAEQRQKSLTGDRVYAVFQPDGYATSYRSEIVAGRMEHDAETLGYEWLNSNLKMALVWTRRDWWEGPETQVTLTDYAFVAELADTSNVFSGYEGITGVAARNSDGGILYIKVLDDPYDEWPLRHIGIFADAAYTRQVAEAGDDVYGTVYVGGYNTETDLAGTFQMITGPVAEGYTASAQWGPVVYNHSDTVHKNYIDIAAAEVTGDLPAATRIELTNTFNDASRAATVLVAQNVFSAPATLTHILEAEDASGGTDTASADHSNGYYNDVSWTATTETKLLDFTLSTALLNACAGNYFRLIARMISMVYTDCWLRWKINLVATPVWEGPKIKLTANETLHDLGLLRLPPNLIGTADLYPLTLALYGTRNAAGTHHLYIDFVQVSPVDGWRKLIPHGFNLDYEARLVDDGIEDVIYTDNWSTPGRIGNYTAQGERIALWPGRAQRLYFLHDNDTGGAPILRALSVAVFYRPRRLTL